MTTHCRFNNMPCMRGCTDTACRLYADWSKAQGARDRAILDTQQTMRLASAAAGMTWWEPPPPPPRYDGSLDDWDVDEFIPSGKAADLAAGGNTTERIIAKLKEHGITFNFGGGDFDNAWVEFTFPDGVTLETDQWGE